MTDKRKPKTDPADEGTFAYEGLDRVLHEKARLGIVTALINRPEGLLFGDLKHLCDLTDGNLSRHLQVLHGAELVEIWKASGPGRPQTLVRVSDTGRESFRQYLEELSSVIRDAKKAQRRPVKSDPPPGFAPA